MKHILLFLLAAIELPTEVYAIFSKIDLMTNETLLKAYLPSSTTITNRIGTQEKATIWIRCRVKENRMNSLEAYIDTPNYNDNNSVAFRWNQGEPIKV